MSILGNSKLLVSAVSTWNNSGIKQAEKSIGKFEKNLGKLARTLGLTFSAVAVVAFGKASVKAFLADDKAAKALGQTLKNTGNELAGKGANSFIDKLQRATGVSDGQLRPALTNLLNSTRDYKTSQQELNLALDIAAGTSKDVISVSAALSKAYAGNTGALSKLGTGISKTLLASGDMVKINKELARLFAGQSAIAANTYAGKIDRIKVAADEAKETIGKGLIDALTMLGKNKGVDDITKQMDNLSLSIADVIRGIGTLSDPSQPKSFVGFLAATISELYKYSAIRKGILALEQRGAASRLAGTATQGMPSGAMGISASEGRTKAALEKKARDDAARLKREAAAKLAAEKKLAALKKVVSIASAAFDLNKINIQAALKQTIDEDTRKRLLLMQALEGDNEALIMQRLKELADFTQNADLRKLAGLKTITDAQLKALNDTLIAEVDAINKSKMSQDDKNKAIMEALNKYDAAVKAQGGATADQSDNLRILQIRNILAISQAQAIADKQKQDALDLYMKTLGLSPGKSIATNGAYVPPTLAEQVAIGAIGGTMSSGITTNNSSMGVGSNMSPAQLAAAQFGGGGSTTINNITVEGTVVDSAGLLAAIQGGVQTINRNGSSLSGVAGILATYL